MITHRIGRHIMDISDIHSDGGDDEYEEETEFDDDDISETILLVFVVVSAIVGLIMFIAFIKWLISKRAPRNTHEIFSTSMLDSQYPSGGCCTRF
jgi:hypothetical protein